MRGSINSKQRCVKCGQRFTWDRHGMVCGEHGTRPTRYFVDIYEQGDHVRIYSTREGRSLDSYAAAQRMLEHCRYLIDRRGFDPNDFRRGKLKELTFEVCAKRWLAHCERKMQERRLRPGTLYQIKRHVSRHLVPFFGKRDIREIRSLHIEEFLSSIPEKYSASYRADVLKYLKKMLRDYHDWEEIERLPKFPRIRIEEKDIEWIDEGTQEKIFQHIPECDRPIFLFLMRQWCRPSEARALMWKDLDLEKGTATIRRTFSRDVLIESTKQHRAHMVPLHPQVWDWLAMEADRRELVGESNPDAFVFQPSRVMRKRRKPLANVHKDAGYHYDRTVITLIWKRACKRAGIDHIDSYSGLRHSGASQAINRDVPIQAISFMLGHRKIAQTQRYAQQQATSLRHVLESKQKGEN